MHFSELINRLSKRYQAQKSTSPEMRGSTFCPQYIFRRKLIWRCPSFEIWPIFRFGAISVLYKSDYGLSAIIRTAPVDTRIFGLGTYLSESSRWTYSENRTTDSVLFCGRKASMIGWKARIESEKKEPHRNRLHNTSFRPKGQWRNRLRRANTPRERERWFDALVPRTTDRVGSTL